MLNQLRKLLESEKKDKRIFDILIYGSFVKGKSEPKDIDIIVIFLEGTLRERLDKVQDIKSKLKSLNASLDLKQMLLRDFFAPEFLARTGIIVEGFSIFQNKSFASTLGFRPSTLFWYTLESLSHNEKVKFNYIMAGRLDMKGLIREFQGERLANGAVKIPIGKSLEFEDILKKNKVNYNKKDILEVI